MTKYVPWAVVLLGLGGIVNNVATASIPIISDIGDLTFAGILFVVGLYGYLG